MTLLVYLQNLRSTKNRDTSVFISHALIRLEQGNFKSFLITICTSLKKIQSQTALEYEKDVRNIGVLLPFVISFNLSN
jgi:hypothetical protein